uniref:Uncharacterized protein n=1 Tax=Panagrolaimus sp. JU765 TaxID=591449 RepID=A0AC34RM13_9BILA
MAVLAAGITYSSVYEFSMKDGKARDMSSRCFVKLAFYTVQSRITAERATEEFDNSDFFGKVGKVVSVGREVFKYEYYEKLLKYVWEERQEHFYFEPIFVFIGMFVIALFAGCFFRACLDYKQFSCGRLVLTFLTMYTNMIVVIFVFLAISIFFTTCDF